MPKITRRTLVETALILAERNRALSELNERLSARLKALGDGPFLKQLERVQEKK